MIPPRHRLAAIRRLRAIGVSSFSFGGASALVVREVLPRDVVERNRNQARTQGGEPAEAPTLA